MDDIDVGVDSIVDAKQALKSIDLVLQTKQVRLNSGKTQILTRGEALRHFRVSDNRRLDILTARVDRKLKAGLPLDHERKLVERRIAGGLAKKAFDWGNGEKILKRWFTLASRLSAIVSPTRLEQLFRLRPGFRDNVLSYIRASPLTSARARALANAATSGMLIDDAAFVTMSNSLVETRVLAKYQRHDQIERIISATGSGSDHGLYCRLWLQSKYSGTEPLLDTMRKYRNLWFAHEKLGRIVGAFRPLFAGTPLEGSYLELIVESHNTGARETYKFQQTLSSDVVVFRRVYPALKTPNLSRGTGITHAKFLCLVGGSESRGSDGNEGYITQEQCAGVDRYLLSDNCEVTEDHMTANANFRYSGSRAAVEARVARDRVKSSPTSIRKRRVAPEGEDPAGDSGGEAADLGLQPVICPQGSGQDPRATSPARRR